MEETTIPIRKTLLNQIETLAQQIGLSNDGLIELAVESYRDTLSARTPLAVVGEGDGEPTPPNYGANAERRVEIRQGDVYWIHSDETTESELGYFPHPYVVVQETVLNRSRISSVVVCALTTNSAEAKAPGNVLLDVGEANLPKRSIVVVSKVSTVEKAQLGEYIGTLAQPRVEQILAGMRFLQTSFFTR